MDALLAEIYATILPSAPYIIAAYVLVWLVLCVYVIFIARSMQRTNQRLAALEEELLDRMDTGCL